MTTQVLVIVKWVDATYERDPADARKCDLIELHTVGWLVHEDKQKLVIAAETSPDGTYRDVNVIPSVGIIWRSDRKVRLP